jgi:hypothetical protein
VEPGPAWSFRAPLGPVAEDSLVEECLASDSLRAFWHFPFMDAFGFIGFGFIGFGFIGFGFIGFFPFPVPYLFFLGLIFLNLHLPEQQSLSFVQLDLQLLHKPLIQP